MIDTHCHLTYDPLASMLDDVLARAAGAGVKQMITIGTSPDDAAKSAALAARLPQVFFAAGLHPHHAGKYPDMALLAAQLELLAAQPKCVAVGEMGLDRHYSEPTIDVQKRVFATQLAFAKKLGKPIVIHNREATDETLELIREAGIPGERFVFHCFTGTDEELDKILAINAYVSFTGIVTFKSSERLLASTLRVPNDRILIETDAPYLTPAPHRKVKANEPRYIEFTTRCLAEKRGMSFEAFDELTTANAARFFRLPA